MLDYLIDPKAIEMAASLSRRTDFSTAFFRRDSLPWRLSLHSIESRLSAAIFAKTIISEVPNYHRTL